MAYYVLAKIHITLNRYFQFLCLSIVAVEEVAGNVSSNVILQMSNVISFVAPKATRE